jgi:pantoate--beta-alanine ligase
MRIVQSREDLRRILRDRRRGSIGFAPTMGYLHDGHLSLFRAARAENDTSVVSIFVNPTQFGPNEDLSRYPRDPEGDVEKCRACGVDVVWMPGVDDMYPPDTTTTVHVGGVTDGLCGPRRPGHFDGVATVVAKLLNSVRPDRAYFGAKDFQQLAVIRRMVRDLDIDVQIVGMPTIRERDGLAMSSRNVYLSADDRVVALRIPAALRAAAAAYADGERSAAAVRQAALAVLADGSDLRLEYADVVDPDTLAAIDGDIAAKRGAVLAIAARVGSTRLIDNDRVDRSAVGPDRTLASAPQWSNTDGG